MSLSLLFFFTCIAALVGFWWQSDRIKIVALQKITQTCQSQGLQLLDQTMVLGGLWIARDDEGRLVLRRRYRFEFTSTGSSRYAGEVILFGNRISSIQLEPHIIPEDKQHLH